jgi:hypothetical protein
LEEADTAQMPAGLLFSRERNPQFFVNGAPASQAAIHPL